MSTTKPISNELSQIRELLTLEKINPNYAFEFYCPQNKVEGMKSAIRNKATGECHFFTRPDNNQIHVISIVNIKLKELPKDQKCLIY